MTAGELLDSQSADRLEGGILAMDSTGPFTYVKVAGTTRNFTGGDVELVVYIENNSTDPYLGDGAGPKIMQVSASNVSLEHPDMKGRLVAFTGYEAEQRLAEQKAGRFGSTMLALGALAGGLGSGLGGQYSASLATSSQSLVDNSLTMAKVRDQQNAEIDKRIQSEDLAYLHEFTLYPTPGKNSVVGKVNLGSIEDHGFLDEGTSGTIIVAFPEERGFEHRFPFYIEEAK